MTHFKNGSNPLTYDVITMATKLPMLKYRVFGGGFLTDKKKDDNSGMLQDTGIKLQPCSKFKVTVTSFA